jgi:hypothetical protein
MTKRKLGNSNLEVSAIGLAKPSRLWSPRCWRTGRQVSASQEASAVLVPDHYPCIVT